MANHPNLQPTQPGETEAERQARQAEGERLLDEAEAERIGTIPFEEVEAWVRSWGTPNATPCSSRTSTSWRAVSGSR
jgi:hypothetical protein